MPTLTSVNAQWTNTLAVPDADSRRINAGSFVGDGTNLGARGGIVRHGDTSLAVTVNGSDQITVQAGVVAIPSSVALAGVYMAAFGAVTGPSAGTAIATRNSTNPRIDLVIADVSSGVARIRTVEGTPSSSPVVPTLTAGQIELARLSVPVLGGSAVTVDSTWRPYAASLGGVLPVENVNRLPGSGNQKGQRATALDTGLDYRWNGSAWIDDSRRDWVVAYEGPDTYNSAAPASAANIAGGGPYNVTVPNGRTLDIEVQLPRLELNGLGGLQVWLTAGAGQVAGGYWDNPSGNGLSTSGRLTHSVPGTGAAVAINVLAFKLGTNGGNIRGISGQQGPRIKYRIS